MAGPNNTILFLFRGPHRTFDSSASAILNGMPIKDDVIPLSESAMKLPRKALEKTAFVFIRCSAPLPPLHQKRLRSEAFFFSFGTKFLKGFERKLTTKRNKNSGRRRRIDRVVHYAIFFFCSFFGFHFTFTLCMDKNGSSRVPFRR